MTGLLPLGGAVGAIIGGVFAERKGRRYDFIVFGILTIFSGCLSIVPFTPTFAVARIL
jgi:MFS family permease